ncbi:MAG: long-chain fatty acid--CoA ligase [Calditrichaeota bacterium]|nr:long-chain fatty acid--CoA ligase [Calditrichota bacterium]
MVWKKLHTIIESHPDKEALVFQNHRISYRALGEIINRLANGLRKAGIEKGDRVALILPNVPHFVFSYYAALQIGAQIIPLNYLMELDDLNQVLNKADPKAVIFWGKFRNLLSSYFSNENDSLVRIVLGKKLNGEELSLTHLIASADEHFQAEEISPHEIGAIQFTAGTSASPQGALLSHSSLTESCRGITKFFRFSDSDVFLAVLPLAFGVSQSAVMNAALNKGATLVLMPKLDIESIIRMISEERVTTVVGSPRLFQKIAELETPIEGQKLKICLSVNNFLSESIREAFEQKIGVHLLNAYSVTEAGGIVAAMHPSSFNPRNSMGMVLPHVEIQLFQDGGELLPVGERGELLIRGASLFSGYFQNDELTANRLRDGWFHSGDIGKKDVDAFIYFIDRKCDTILKSGFQILARDVETILRTHPRVKEVAVIPVPHPKFKQDVKAYIVTKGNSLTQTEVLEFCKQKFPMYMCPSLIEFRSQLPRTRMGKISKRKLKNEVWL